MKSNCGYGDLWLCGGSKRHSKKEQAAMEILHKPNYLEEVRKRE